MREAEIRWGTALGGSDGAAGAFKDYDPDLTQTPNSYSLPALWWPEEFLSELYQPVLTDTIQQFLCNL